MLNNQSDTNLNLNNKKKKNIIAASPAYGGLKQKFQIRKQLIILSKICMVPNFYLFSRLQNNQFINAQF